MDPSVAGWVAQATPEGKPEGWHVRDSVGQTGERYTVGAGAPTVRARCGGGDHRWREVNSELLQAGRVRVVTHVEQVSSSNHFHGSQGCGGRRLSIRSCRR